MQTLHELELDISLILDSLNLNISFLWTWHCGDILALTFTPPKTHFVLEFYRSSPSTQVQLTLAGLPFDQWLHCLAICVMNITLKAQSISCTTTKFCDWQWLH